MTTACGFVFYQVLFAYSVDRDIFSIHDVSDSISSFKFNTVGKVQ